MSDKNKLLVSIWMITYNHEKYIEKAIESIINQNTSFSIELIIGDDCSTDNTIPILKKYALAYPSIVKPYFNDFNVGMMNNMIKTLNNCNGKYIALCEGDDYWTDLNKIESQIVYLENNLHVSMCFTNRIEVDNNDCTINNVKYEHKIYSTKDIIKGFIPPTQTIVLRKREDLTLYLQNYVNNPSGDRLLSYFCSLFGEIHLLPIVTAAYRRSGEGVWNSYNHEEQFFISLQRYIEFHLSIGLPANNEYIHQRINGAFFYLLKKDYIYFIHNFRKIIRIKKLYNIKSHFFQYALLKLHL